MTSRSSKRVFCWAGWTLVLLAPLAISLQAQSPRVEILTSVKHGVTPPLRSFVPFIHAKPNPARRVIPLGRPVPPEAKGGKPGGGGGGGKGGGHNWTDQDLVPPTTSQNGHLGSLFTGIVNGCGSEGGCVPPDPNLSVSPTQIVETVNVSYEVWDKPSFGGDSAVVDLSQAPIHTVFAGLGNGDICATTDGGDPIVLWDNYDQRWIISQLAYNFSLSNDHWCMAISQTSSASGAYDAYDFSFGSNFPDYPKLGIWLDGTNSTAKPGPYSGLYFSANIFAHGNKFSGAETCAFPLSDVSNPPSNQNMSMTCMQQSSSVYSILPADTDGSGAGPSGTGGLYLQFLASSGVGSTLDLYEFRPDFSVASNSTFSLAQSIPVNTYHEACGGSACIPQPGTSQQLDSLGDRLMYRLAYRNSTVFPDTLFVDQSVQVDSSSSQTGIRWYEIQDATSNPNVIQGTYSPSASTLYRWMGSIAADQYGDLGLGYSTSDSSTPPGLAFTGRAAGESPANALDPETSIFTGAGSQTGIDRWGDYSSISVDPSDDCTFWYVNEYLQTTGSYTNWATEIASFRVGDSCTH